MPFAQWDESLSIGAEPIDGQHQWLFTILNRLATHIGSPDEEKAVVRCLVDMERYALIHFAAEEAFMREVGYDGLEKHRTVHQGFARSVESYREALINGDIAALDMAGYLRDWLINHVRGADMAIRHHLQSR